MNTKLIMTLSAIFLALIGVCLTFLPVEIAGLTGIGTSKALLLLLQILGALYFSFAMLNWMAKGSIIGGIYNRPVALANFTHFFIVAIYLVKALMNNHALPIEVWLSGGVYAVFAVLFWMIFSRHPVGDKNV
ncbi:MAG TPA: hypothetical protein DCO83_12295 [Mucilaginibacter sp.]|jgi:hypothetical protein|nr:hypothetical protein [Mucilaginibacter sp.]